MMHRLKNKIRMTRIGRIMAVGWELAPGLQRAGALVGEGLGFINAAKASFR